MNVGIIGDREFITPIKEQDGVWVLMVDQSLYARTTEGGRALPGWDRRTCKSLMFWPNLDMTKSLSPTQLMNSVPTSKLNNAVKSCRADGPPLDVPVGPPLRARVMF